MVISHLVDVRGGVPVVDVPKTRYAKTVDGVHVAYQVFGEGPLDLLFSHGEISHRDASWEMPEFAALQKRLASSFRVVAFDRRGSGLSDRHVGASAFEAGMDDIGAVMDAAESQRALLLGHQDGGMLCALFAASFPERTLGLVLFNAFARSLWAPDYPWAWTDREWDEYLRGVDEGWGTVEHAQQHLEALEPGRSFDPEHVDRWARYFRAAGSPGDVIALESMVREADVRSVLSLVHVPTVVVATAHDGFLLGIEEGRYLADHIAGAEFVELPCVGYTPFFEAQDPLIERLEGFARRIRSDEAELDRVLATVLFTDIVDSTAHSAAVGDRAWAEVRAQHDQLVRSCLARFRGREIKTTGDGFLATFDGPARGVRCAQAIVEGTGPLRIEVRAGLHTGEVRFEADDIAGLGVTIGARVGALANPSQVLVSQTVKDLVAGSGLVFDDAGEHALKGVPDHWHLYRVIG